MLLSEYQKSYEIKPLLGTWPRRKIPSSLVWHKIWHVPENPLDGLIAIITRLVSFTLKELKQCEAYWNKTLWIWVPREIFSLIHVCGFIFKWDKDSKREKRLSTTQLLLSVLTVLSFKFSEQSLCKRSKKYSTDIFP